MEPGHISIHPCIKMNLGCKIIVADVVSDSMLCIPISRLNIHVYLDMNIISCFSVRIISFLSPLCVYLCFLYIVLLSSKSGCFYFQFEYLHLLHSLFLNLFGFLSIVTAQMTLIMIEKRVHIVVNSEKHLLVTLLWVAC